jgi:hypothetical protein
VIDNVAAGPAPAVSEPPASSGAGGRSRAGQIPLVVLTILAGGMLLVGSAVGTIGLVVAVAAVQALLVIGWVFGSGLPGRIGAVVLGLLASGAADATVIRWHENGYEPVLGVLGVAIPVVFIHQLTRGVVRTRVVESLSDIALLLLSVTAIVGLILLRYQDNGDRTVLAVVGAVAAGLAVNQLTDALLPAPRFDPVVDRGLPAVLTGVVAGGVVGLVTLRELSDFAGGRSAFAGAAVAAVACLLSIGASFAGVHSTLTPPRTVVGPDVDEIPVWVGVPRLRPVAAVMITFALSSPAGYVLINALRS